MRGAPREITGLLVARGYKPAARWSEEELDEDGYAEWTRSFKPGTDSDIDAMLMIASIPLTDSRATRHAPR